MLNADSGAPLLGILARRHAGLPTEADGGKRAVEWLALEVDRVAIAKRVDDR